MQLVLEFGSKQLGPVLEATRHAVGKLPYTIECLSKGRNNNETTEEESLAFAAAKLEAEATSTLTLRPRTGPIRYALILPPRYGGQDLSLYLGTIEYTQRDYMQIWDTLLRTNGLTVACIGYDEGVELRDNHLSVETFPWNDWPLVVGALRSNPESPSWITREGPEMKWLTEPTQGSVR